MPRRTSLLILMLGLGWAQSLTVLGLSMLFASTLSGYRVVPAAGLTAAGLFVAMWLVIDRLVPQAQQGFVLSLKFAAVLIFYAATAVSVYGVLTGRATILFLPN